MFKFVGKVLVGTILVVIFLNLIPFIIGILLVGVAGILSGLKSLLNALKRFITVNSTCEVTNE